MATPTQLESLREALSLDRPPFCSGSASPKPEGLHLYYGKENPRFINFASATPKDLDLLTAACNPATFGCGKKEVYDESYRKAVKMDPADFAITLDPAGFGLTRTIEDQLLQGETEKMRIKAQLHQLNVYGTGSFFKAHKDTPRGKGMLGSLVITYPTPYEGGELVLRHKGREWKFDTKASTVAQSSPSLAYVAFYSDIEHEVLKVTSGHRVTITYDLYLDDPAWKPKASARVVPDICMKSDSNLQTRLKGLLESPEFLPSGGTLGFGLAHLYPVSFNTKLEEMASYLKGEDARVYRACLELGLQPSLKIIYDDEPSQYGIMLDRIVQDPGYTYMTDTYEDALVNDYGGVPVNKVEGAVIDHSPWVEEEGVRGEFITWISPFNGLNRLEDDKTECYGNEPAAECIYCSPCIIARVPTASDRV